MISSRRRVVGAIASSAATFALASLILTSSAGAQAVPSAAPNAVTPPVITTTAGTGAAGFSGDGGPAVSAKVNAPSGVAEDLAGNIYFGDTANNRVRKVTAGGIVSTVAGNGASGFSGDGGQARLARLAGPTGVALDSSGNLYIADSGNGRVRKVTAAGVISTVAGNGSGFFSCGSGGNGGPATRAGLCAPTSVALDSGNLYIADVGNSQIRKVNSAGIISAAAGSGTYGSNGDGGPATSAKLANPTAVTFDTLHGMYIGDTGNFKVRKVTAGVITTFAGTGSFGYSGDGNKATLAKMTTPSGLGVDGLGNVYIADTFNSRIRVVIPKGDILTYAGTGTAGYSGDGGPAIAAKINQPSGNIAVDANNIFFGDTTNNRVRRVQGGPPPNIPEIPFSIALLPLSAAALLGGYVIARHRRAPAPVAVR